MVRRRNTTVAGLLDSLEREGADVSAARRVAVDGRAFGYIPVVWNRRLTSTAGKARTRLGRPFQIDLNPRLIDEGLDALRSTFLHELAHMLAGFKAGHGPAWKAEVRAIGGSDSRCHQYQSMKAVRGARPRQARHHVATCSRCNHELQRTRALPHGKVYKHVGCGGVFIPR